MKMVERKFEVKINAVQFDGGKYFSFLITTLGVLGLTHRITCPYSSFQNGAMEYRNNKVVKKGLALLFHAKKLLKFWIYAFCTD